jgi:hypothetical protein
VEVDLEQLASGQFSMGSLELECPKEMMVPTKPICALNMTLESLGKSSSSLSEQRQTLPLFVIDPVELKCQELPKLDMEQELGILSLHKILLGPNIVEKEVSKSKETINLRDLRVEVAVIIEVREFSREEGNQKKGCTSGLVSKENQPTGSETTRRRNNLDSQGLDCEIISKAKKKDEI